MAIAPEIASWRLTLRRWLEDPRCERLIITVIAINAITIGFETSPTVMAAIGPLLIAIDTIAVVIFVIELGLKIAAYGWRFFRGPWNIFDFIVVAIALAPASGSLSVLRALRILRALRLVSTVPQMRIVIQALLAAIPGMASVIALMTLVFYVFAVMATMLYGEAFPDWFGTVGASLYSLFQIMTLESWSMGIVRPVMDVFPYAWAFFVPFILITTMAVLNLFIAIVVNSMEKVHSTEIAEHDALHAMDQGAILEELRQIRHEMAALKREKSEGG
ncbi:MAG: ion transporter [Pseudomonadota bacterium]